MVLCYLICRRLLQIDSHIGQRKLDEQTSSLNTLLEVCGTIDFWQGKQVQLIQLEDLSHAIAQ